MAVVNLPKNLPLPGDDPTGVAESPPPGHAATHVTVLRDGVRAEYVGCSGCFVEHPQLGHTNTPWSQAHTTD